MEDKDGEAGLWQRSQQRDARAFDLLQRKYRALVRGEIRKRLYTITEDDLQDIEQAVWLAVWNSLPSFRGHSSFSTWVVAIVKNVAYEWLRQTTAEAQAVACVVSDSRQGAEEPQESQIVMHLVLQEALKGLKNTEREVNHLRYFLQLTDEEVAQRLHLPPGTVKSRLRASLTKLRAILEAMDSEENQ